MRNRRQTIKFFAVIIFFAGMAWGTALIRAGESRGQPVSNNDSGTPSTPPPAMSQADQWYEEGLRAFAAGDDYNAVRLLTAVAAADPACLAVLADPRFEKNLPAGPCRAVAAVGWPAPIGDPAAYPLYRVAELRKAQAERRGGEMARRKAGEEQLRQLIAEHSASPLTDNAALVLVEDGFCLADVGYPECIAWTIKGYEGWLKAYPYSDQKPRVLKTLAERYLILADRLDQPKPWHSPERAELCRGRALELAQAVAETDPDSELSAWAEGFIARIRFSGQPFSTVPREAIPAAQR
jgi:hypothetical protein